MKAVVLYKPNTEFARAVEEFVHEFKARTPHDVEALDADSPQGIALADLYDIVQYPTVLALRDDGQLVKSWSGTPMPLINDVDGYLVA
jgi:hypothetical protein